MLTKAAATAGDRIVALWNAKLPDKPNGKITAKLLQVLRRDMEGTEAYFACFEGSSYQTEMAITATLRLTGLPVR